MAPRPLLLLLLLLATACAQDPEPLADAGPSPSPDLGLADSGDPGPDAGLPDLGEPDLGIGADAGTCVPPAPTGPGQVLTAQGTYQAVQQGTTWAFLGVPFAAPPTGDRRLRAPEPPRCEPALHVADSPGPACPQLNPGGEPTGEEDCLQLNVWIPQALPVTPMPVLVFIHGGGNNHGGNANEVAGRVLADGQALANYGQMVVTIKYRLGALGFLAHPLLDAESGSSGNWAVRDQLAALSWVKQNASAFGADPTRVVVFGESAGGLDICALYTSPLAEGLIQGAIIQSGGCAAASKATANQNATELLEQLGCNTEADPLACLRGKTPAEILTAVPVEVDGLSNPPFGLSVDGVVLPKNPAVALLAGEHLDVPVILGTNRDETYRMLPPPNRVATEAAFEQFVRTFLALLPAAKVDAVLALYPVADYPSPHAALVALTTDFRWGCPAREYLKGMAATGTAPLYRYYFTHNLDITQAPGSGAAGAFHGIELFYLFNVLDLGGYVPTADDLVMAGAIQRYWSRFAATLDPNGGADPAWPTFDPATDSHLQLGVPIVSGTGVRTAQCDALQAILR